MKKLALATTLALSSFIAQADTIAGVYIGGQVWDMQADGSFGSTENLQMFELEDDKKGSYWAALEHPIPLLPNLKLRQNELDTTGMAEVADFQFGDRIYNGDTLVDAELDHLDVIMYYELFDNAIFSIDFGVNFKYAEYAVTVSQNDANPVFTEESLDYHGVIPMLYLATELGILGTGLDVFAEGSWIGFDDHNVYDAMAGIKYEFVDNLVVDLDIRLGYRKMQFDIQDVEDLYLDAQFDGAFAGIELHF
ncbi:TIGR04219 family outer membrane beta-barrel protein [Thalassotalea mangrovi]|uniref:TIGR04219 family outer membrane beta-barrel protein n=1 Tax=Thalassotalea mangrovi TaxID=2572245 RepID=A0A4V6WMM4_9GAMM|nr:TIGR04219 family outer membrane beta-barrel protein [Thalassotalea mangrovi]TKB47704.1 TIGR04219 family outer membrane beta-barrel protein [Thalassotalea mangrovi]